MEGDLINLNSTVTSSVAPSSSDFASRNEKSGPQSERKKGMVILPPTTLSGSALNSMEVSIHQCSKIMLRELAQVFPCLSSVSPSHNSNSICSNGINDDAGSSSLSTVNDTTEGNNICTSSSLRKNEESIKIVDREDVLAIPTIQKSVMDIVQIGPDIEMEKDRCLEVFVEFASALCDEISKHGYWADYIDPCSGLPMLNKERAHHYNEVDGFQHLLRYQTQNAGCCKILLHPKYGSSCYPATLFTVAPKDLILQIFENKFLSS